MFRLPVAEINAFVKNKPKAAFRLQFGDDLNLDLQIEPSILSSSNYRRTIITPEGKRSETRKPDFLYKGISLNKNGGAVRIAIKENFIYGVVLIDNREFVLEPLSPYEGKSQNEYLLYTSDQVIADTTLKCRTDEKSFIPEFPNTVSKKEKQQQDDVRSSASKSIQILQVTDYQMLETYNFNIDSLETFLFANLNISEAVFNSFNFDPLIESDQGDDRIKFEVVETVISTCPSCDVLSKTGKWLYNSARPWIQSNYFGKRPLVCQFWSPRRIFTANLEALGITHPLSAAADCSLRSFNFLKYYTSDPIGLRYLTVHELGHSLGAGHDNEAIPAMKTYFMTSYPVLTATRFSTAADFETFPGYQHLSERSSNSSIRRSMLIKDSCFSSISDTSSYACKLSSPPQAEYFSIPDSVKISWRGNGNYIVKLLQRENQVFNTRDSFFTASSSVIFKDLVACKNYKVGVRQICENDSSSWSEAIIFSNTQLTIEGKKIINKNADKHDLQLKISHNHNKAGKFHVFIDHKPTEFSFSHSPQTIVVKNLFSDGANHRIDIRQFLDEGYCNNIYSYKAPYYRDNSKLLLLNDFNETCTQGNWESIILRPDISGNPQISEVAEKNNDFYFEMGNFDSSCYWRYNSMNFPDHKTIAFTSPPFDATGHYDINLSFDYQYWANPRSMVVDSAFVAAQVFDGNDWATLFKKNRSDVKGPARFFEGVFIWDTISNRIFLHLDSLKSSRMQVRFIAELGTNDSIPQNQMFLALDNIRVDGYSLKELNDPLVFKSFPNPVREELFFEFSKPVLHLLDFRIMDMSGRVVRSGKIANSRILVTGIPQGLYILQVYDSGQLIGKAVKFLKY